MLSGVVPELWFYGFLGAYFTHSLWFSLGVAAILWWMNTVVAVHRNDQFLPTSQLDALSKAVIAIADGSSIEDAAKAMQSEVFDSAADMIVALNLLTPVSILFGVVLGLTVVWALQLPPLLNVELWQLRAQQNLDSVNGKNRYQPPVWFINTSVPRFVLGSITAAVAVNFLLRRFEPLITRGASVGVGILLLVIGLSTALYTLFRWYTSERPADWLNYGYAFALVFLMLTPIAYDFLLSIRPNQGWIFQLVLLAVVVATVIVSVRFFARVQTNPLLSQALVTDIRANDEETRTPRQRARWFVLWLPVAVVYLVAWIRDEQTQEPIPGTRATAGSIGQVLVVVIVASSIFTIIFAFVGISRWQTQRYALWQNNDSVRAPTLPKTVREAETRPVPAQTASSSSTRSDAMGAYRL